MKYAVSLYVVVSIVWIVLTNFYVERSPIPPHMKPYVQTFKGALFVILSAVFMYIALKHIGEPFYTLKEKGMGLGLTMSMKIIHEHKGTMQIESKVGKGTRVHITLPRCKNDPS